MSQAIPITW